LVVMRRIADGNPELRVLAWDAASAALFGEKMAIIPPSLGDLVGIVIRI